MLAGEQIFLSPMSRTPPPPPPEESSNRAISEETDVATMWKNLKEWTTNNGGQVHPSLEIATLQDGQRGVFCQHGTILKGEVLIRLPRKLTLSGDEMPNSYPINETEASQTTVEATAEAATKDDSSESSKQRYVSPWLRCLAAFYQAQSSSSGGSDNFAAYFASLPAKYETVWEWSEEEITTYLAGTTSPAGTNVGWGADDQSIRQRYQLLVRPYLEHCNILPKASPPADTVGAEEYKQFSRACQTLSTRSFHLSITNENQPVATTDGYNGPFLLPIIDMLNHSDTKKCTTLQRTASDFLMVAEREVVEGEEIFHSYDKDLTASQFLQTFGFVPQTAMEKALDPPSAPHSSSRVITPAILSQQIVLDACWAVIESNQAEKLAQSMQEQGMEDEVWTVQVDRARDTSFLPQDILVNLEQPLPNELVTLACLPFLPACAYQEAARTLLDSSILGDYFLGKLTCSALLQAVQRKLECYLPITFEGKIRNSDAVLLKELLGSNEQVSQRLLYGLTVRLEEKESLQASRRAIICILAGLDEEESFGDNQLTEDGSAKRHRII